jgi:hypothetical protein
LKTSKKLNKDIKYAKVSFMKRKNGKKYNLAKYDKICNYDRGAGIRVLFKYG